MQREQYIHIDQDGDKFYYKDKAMTVLHRDDGPAIEWACSDKEWHLNGKRHREDGPAIEYADGSKLWYINHKRHREDGPAVEYANGSKLWYLNDEALTEKQFNERMAPVTELTLEDIAAKFGIAVDKLKIKK
jgi:hypothetical protein